MSLLGNRGRFSQDKNDFLKNINSDLKSEISSNGKNPLRFFNIKNNGQDDKFDIKEKLNKIDVDNYKEEIIPEHQKYNDELRKQDLNFEARNKKQQTSSENKKKKVSIKTIVAMAIVEIITIFVIYMVGSVYRYTNMTQSVPFDIKKVENKEINESTLAIMKGYKTVAVFGVDSRTGSIDKGNNADVNLIINLNLETGDVQLVSIYRDLYLSITDNNLYDKLNSAYRRGGPEQAVKALNKNLDLNIDSYFAFNWKAVADGIELLGGIDLEITKSEYRYMNAFIHETCIATGIDAKNPAGHYIKSAGMQHLDGVQAVAYGRLRLMDSDFQRVERQKKVISLCLEKAKQLDIPRLRLIMEAVLPQIAYAFDMNEMLSLLRIVRTINITESTGCPEVNNLVLMQMGSSGDCVVPLNLEKAVVKLHKVLFNVDDYQVSASARRYSNRITELRVQHAEENRINESIKESKAQDESQATSNTNKPSTSARRKATSSSAKKAVEAASTNKSNLPIDYSGEYEEEPEEDVVSNLPISNRNDNNIYTESTTVVINQAPGSSNSGQVAPGSSNSGQVAPGSSPAPYNAPGVPSNQGSMSPIPSVTPGPTANSQGSGVVVNGPPTGNATGTTAPIPISPGTSNTNNNTPVVPILEAPY